MRKQLFKKVKTAVFGLSLACAPALIKAQQIVDSFLFTGSIQAFTVPCGVTSITIDAYGAQGGNGALGGNSTSGGVGALGGYASGTLAVTPGQVLNIFVGGAGTTPAGGFNGGGNGGANNAGGGGGASDVRLGGIAANNRIITAGGGGGGGRGGCDEGAAIAGIGGNGGIGGGGVGQSGNNSTTTGGFAGGGNGGNFGSIQGALGTAGIGCSGFLGQPGATAITEIGAVGGGGQSCCCNASNSIPGGGGGGGGQIGGGGGGGGSAGTIGCQGNSKGAGGGGGGGSSYNAGMTIAGILSQGLRSGNGKVVISYTNPLVKPSYSLSANAICPNTNEIYACNLIANATSYIWTVTGGLSIVSGQNTSAITIKSLGTGGNISVIANTICGTTPSSTPIAISIIPAPTASITGPVSALCAGTPVNLNGLPVGGTYSVASGNPSALVGNVFNAPTAGIYSIAYTVSASGCSDSAQLTFNVACVLGLGNTLNNNSQLMIMPNPNNGQFTITSTTEIDGSIELINELGQIVYRSRMNGLEKSIDAKSISTGIYHLRIRSGATIQEKRLSIIR